jgi:hypothetical protein
MRGNEPAATPSTLQRRLAERVVQEQSREVQKGAGSIFSLDSRVVAWARDKGWGELARAAGELPKIAKERRAKIGPDFSPSVRIVLEFLGAYRKLALEYLIQTVGARIDPSAYSTFLESAGVPRGSVLGAIDSLALGSTRLTSDYDLTLAGPAVHTIMLAVVKQMQAQTHSTSSFLFDSNLYIAPDLVVCPELETRLAAMRVDPSTRLLRAPAPSRRATPVPPDDETYVAKERASILAKIGKDDAHLSEEEIMKRYEALAAAGERLDAMLYRNRRGASPSSSSPAPAPAHDLYDILLEMNQLGMEAYHGLSTILMVVNGMQGGRSEEVTGLLGKGHKLNAALENVVDLTNHWNAAMAASGGGAEGAKELEKYAASKVAKYATRIVHCLDAAGVDSPLKERLRAGELLEILRERTQDSAKTMAKELGIPIVSA